MTRPLAASTAVVITGASSGIGRAAARAFARRGVRLALAARSLDELEAVAAECRALGGEAVALQADTGDAAAVRRLAEAAAAALGGRIDVWVNNAGVAAFGPFEETPVQAHERVIRTNLLGYIHGAHAALPYFRRQGRGVLINVVSMAGWVPTPFASTYSASKFGNRGFSEALRLELAGAPGVKVCDVHPAFVDTPMLQRTANWSGAKLVAVPLVVTAEQVAEKIVSLAARPRDFAPVGLTFYAALALHRLAPRLFRWGVGRAAQAYVARGPRAEPTEATLFSPDGRGGGVRGGWRSPAARAGAVAIVGAGAALALAFRLRPERS